MQFQIACLPFSCSCSSIRLQEKPSWRGQSSCAWLITNRAVVKRLQDFELCLIRCSDRQHRISTNRIYPTSRKFGHVHINWYQFSRFSVRYPLFSTLDLFQLGPIIHNNPWTIWFPCPLTLFVPHIFLFSLLCWSLVARHVMFVVSRSYSWSLISILFHHRRKNKFPTIVFLLCLLSYIFHWDNCTLLVP